jgi:hypothetical protein
MTIKTQGGKVITQEGKVSCECCDVDCCPYPADAVGRGLVSSGDLPDQIEVSFGAAFDGALIFEKTGLEYQYFFDGGAVGRVFVDDDLIPGKYNWRFQYIQPDLIDPNGLLNANEPECLITDPEVVGPDGARDLFADTYTISGPISGIVTRDKTLPFPERSLCVWLGEGLRLTNFGFQWKVNGNNKSGFQNTPEGSYAGGFTVS